MSTKVDEIKFLLKNIFYPHAKVQVCLGTDELGMRYQKYFQHRSWKRGFIPNKKYNCAVIHLSQFSNFEDYISSVKGKNSADYFSRRCEKMGYTWKHFNPNNYLDEIYAVHTSVETRQGRVMDASYQQKVSSWPSDEQNIWIGVFDQENKLVSYVWLVILNELALMNRIIGDGNKLKDNIMYLNVVGVIEWLKSHSKTEYLMNDTFGRKQNGLVLFKKRFGFKPFTLIYK